MSKSPSTHERILVFVTAVLVFVTATNLCIHGDNTLSLALTIAWTVFVVLYIVFRYDE